MTLDVIESDHLSATPHGFFTRRGGASSGVFEGLNCGYGSSDQREIVSINRDRAAGAMGLTQAQLVGVHQIHSATVAQATEKFDTPPLADAIVTATPGIALSILTADCQPILFSDPENRVIGAAHAGWKGALNGVIEATVQEMERLGAKRSSITAVIGPSISQNNYEVGPEFRDRFIAENPEYASYFITNPEGRYQFDLPAFGLSKLAEAGIGKSYWTGHCTYADPDRFFSYRRSVHQKQADYGRLVSAIRL